MATACWMVMKRFAGTNLLLGDTDSDGLTDLFEIQSGCLSPVLWSTTETQFPTAKKSATGLDLCAIGDAFTDDDSNTTRSAATSDPHTTAAANFDVYANAIADADVYRPLRSH